MKSSVEIEEILNLTYNLNEIFLSIQGESTRAGLPCVFIRMQGCELRCSWCDTDYALDLGIRETVMTGKEIIEKIESFDCKYLTFTGGEPLMQRNIIPLMELLYERGYTVAVETNGHQCIKAVDDRIIKIMDIKTNSSRQHEKNNYENIQYLGKHDEVKFVIANREDYDFACGISDKYKLPEKVRAVLISPVFGMIEPSELAEWMLSEKRQFRYNLQIHKYIWDPKKRGV
jgi:7-carboxy-7-deazaguanine synthase